MFGFGYTRIISKEKKQERKRYKKACSSPLYQSYIHDIECELYMICHDSCESVSLEWDVHPCLDCNIVFKMVQRAAASNIVNRGLCLEFRVDHKKRTIGCTVPAHDLVNCIGL